MSTVSVIAQEQVEKAVAVRDGPGVCLVHRRCRDVVAAAGGQPLRLLWRRDVPHGLWRASRLGVCRSASADCVCDLVYSPCIWDFGICSASCACGMRGLLVLVTALITRELGGGAIRAGAGGVLLRCAGVYLILFHRQTMNAFEPLLWMGCAYVVIRVIKTGNQKLWLWFGVLPALAWRTNTRWRCSASPLS